MSKFLRLGFVRDEAGIALTVGDVYGITGRKESLTVGAVGMPLDEAEINSLPARYLLDRHIKSFAPRKNEGVQPVGDDVVVDVARPIVVGQPKTAKATAWEVGFANSVTTWKPNYDALLKMQNEFDEKESEVIADKEMKIVDAVCYIGSVAVEMRDAGLITTPSKSNTYYKEHEVYRSSYKGLGELNNRWKVVCTIAEFNQCIEEMAAAKWLTGKVQSYDAHKWVCEKHMGIDISNKRLQAVKQENVYTQAMFDAGEKPLVGMKCDIRLNVTFHGKSIITYISDSNVCFIHNGVESSVNVNVATFECIETRTPEEIEAEELEAAKKEQREIVAGALSCEHNKKFNDHEPTVPSDFLDEAGSLQDLGLLDKIILPLKG